MKTVALQMPNRDFCALLRQVARGTRITVTSRGKPVATLCAIGPGEGRERSAARRALLARLRAAPVTGERNSTRDQLYE
jgi:prevent-host-death family protein